MNWILENQALIYTALGAAYGLLCVVVKLTPTPYDDELLKRAMLWVSLFKPRGEGVIKRPFSSGPRTGDQTIPPIIIFALALSLLPTLTGCASGQTQVQDGSDAAHMRRAKADLYLGMIEAGLVELEAGLVAPYEAKGAECRLLPTEAEYDDCMKGWERALDGLTVVYHQVRIDRAGLALADGADPIPCVASAVADVLAALDDLTDIPDSVGGYLAAAEGLAAALGNECSMPIEDAP